MAAPSIYLDECIDYSLVNALQQRGYNVSSVLDEAMAEVDDERQLSYAAAQGRMLVSHNEKDFWRLHREWQARRQKHHGILLVPQRTSFEVLVLRSAMMLEWIQTLETSVDRLHKWGQLQERLEQGYRLPGFSEREVQQVLGRM